MINEWSWSCKRRNWNQLDQPFDSVWSNTTLMEVGESSLHNNIMLEAEYYSITYIKIVHGSHHVSKKLVLFIFFIIVEIRVKACASQWPWKFSYNQFITS